MPYPIEITVEDADDPVEIADAVVTALEAAIARGGSGSSEVLDCLSTWLANVNAIIAAQT